MTKSRHTYVAATFAKVLTACLSDDQLAVILNGLLCCDENEKLSDYEIGAGNRLFDAISDQRPEAVAIAAKGQ
jgi:hypothetical protein